MLSLAHNALSAVGSAVADAEAAAEKVAGAAVAAPVLVAEKAVEAIADIFTWPDKKILNLIYSTHVHKHDDNFDEESMFVIVESIIKRSYQIVDNLVQVFLFILTFVMFLHEHELIVRRSFLSGNYNNFEHVCPICASFLYKLHTI